VHRRRRNEGWPIDHRSLPVSIHSPAPPSVRPSFINVKRRMPGSRHAEATAAASLARNGRIAIPPPCGRGFGGTHSMLSILLAPKYGAQIRRSGAPGRRVKSVSRRPVAISSDVKLPSQSRVIAMDARDGGV
jgi:hypothetical protein